MFLLIPLSLFMQHIHDLSLHSTMFLLILIAVKLLLGLQAFTFHDVSINTDTTQSRKDSVLNFTFHDVSINTKTWKLRSNSLEVFTFHDVSINTEGLDSEDNREATLHSTMFLLILSPPLLHLRICLLYIPRCFY